MKDTTIDKIVAVILVMLFFSGFVFADRLITKELNLKKLNAQKEKAPKCQFCPICGWGKEVKQIVGNCPVCGYRLCF